LRLTHDLCVSAKRSFHLFLGMWRHDVTQILKDALRRPRLLAISPCDVLCKQPMWFETLCAKIETLCANRARSDTPLASLTCLRLAGLTHLRLASLTHLRLAGLTHLRLASLTHSSPHQNARREAFLAGTTVAPLGQAGRGETASFETLLTRNPLPLNPASTSTGLPRS